MAKAMRAAGKGRKVPRTYRLAPAPEHRLKVRIPHERMWNERWSAHGS